MALEQDVHAAVDALVSRLRDTLESDIRGLVDDLIARTATERQKQVDEARREVEAGRNAAVAAARAEVYDKATADAAAKVKAETERLRQEIDQAVAKAKEDAAAEQVKAVAAEAARVRAEAEEVLAATVAETQAAAEESVAAEARAEAERALKGEIAKARDDGTKSQQAALAAVARMLDAVRRLDAAPTLTATLDTLTELVAAEAGRVAVFVQSNGEMRGWRFAGFGPEVGDARARVLNGGDAGFLSRAIGERQTRVLASGADRAASNRPPGFASLPADRSALAVPVLVGGEAMVVVYADDVDAERRSPLSQWSDAVELLARHAGRRLESLTAERAAALASGVPLESPLGFKKRPTPAPPPPATPFLTPKEAAPSTPAPAKPAAPAAPPAAAKAAAPAAPPAAPKPAAPAAPPPAPKSATPSAAASEDEEAARRYARLLVSEIKLYNEAAVNEGRAARDLGLRLKGEIDRARTLYEERIPETVRSRELFFDQELVRTLADGDAELLGT